MQKLLKLKKWLTLENAALHLSALLDENVSVADILQLAIDRKITLSVNLVNKARAKPVDIVPFSEARLVLDPQPGEPLYVSLQREKARKAPKFHEKPVGLCVPPSRELLHGSPFFEGKPLPDNSGVLQVNHHHIFEIEGLWNLSMIGAESLELEQRFHQLTGGPELKSVDVSGIFLQSPTTGKWVCLHKKLTDSHPDYNPSGYFPQAKLSSDVSIVVRPAELQRLTEIACEVDINKTTRISGEEDLPEALSLLLAAHRLHWGNASRTDKETHPKNNKVIQYLEKQGMSNNQATVSAALIRPDWAPRGGRPRE